MTNRAIPATLIGSIDAAIEVFIISLKVRDAITHGRWDIGSLVEKLPLHMKFKGETENTWLRIHHRKIDTEDLKLWADNQEYYAIAMLIVAVDTALEKAFGRNIKSDSDIERRALRAITYMLRCAHAHNPIHPVWVCRGDYRKTFEVPSLGLKLEGARLHGKPVESSDYGGWSKLKLLSDRARKNIEAAGKGSIPLTP